MKKIVSIMLAAVMLSLVPGMGMLGGMVAFAFEIAPVDGVVYETVYETVYDTVYDVVYDTVEDFVYEVEDEAFDVFTLSIGQNTASVFGEIKESDVQPIIRNDRTMLPARFVAENLGAEVSWDGETRTVLVKSEDVEIKLTIDSAVAVVNGVEEMLDSPAFIENDRTYTPVRFIAEKLGSTVNWDAETQTVIMSKPVKASVPEVPAEVTTKIVGTLGLEDFRYEYEEGGHMVEMNEGAIGGMHLIFGVTGPENVCDVLISQWRDTPYSEEEIQSAVESSVKMWKNSEFQVYPEQIPFECNTSHPVDAEDLGKTMYVVLIGLDANGDAAGYAVVEEIVG